jgi:hypothetical protein
MQGQVLLRMRIEVDEDSLRGARTAEAKIYDRYSNLS